MTAPELLLVVWGCGFMVMFVATSFFFNAGMVFPIAWIIAGAVSALWPVWLITIAGKSLTPRGRESLRQRMRQERAAAKWCRDMGE